MDASHFRQCGKALAAVEDTEADIVNTKDDLHQYVKTLSATTEGHSQFYYIACDETTGRAHTLSIGVFKNDKHERPVDIVSMTTIDVQAVAKSIKRGSAKTVSLRSILQSKTCGPKYIYNIAPAAHALFAQFGIVLRGFHDVAIGAHLFMQCRRRFKTGPMQRLPLLPPGEYPLVGTKRYVPYEDRSMLFCEHSAVGLLKSVSDDPAANIYMASLQAHLMTRQGKLIKASAMQQHETTAHALAAWFVWLVIDMDPRNTASIRRHTNMHAHVAQSSCFDVQTRTVNSLVYRVPLAPHPAAGMPFSLVDGDLPRDTVAPQWQPEERAAGYACSEPPDPSDQVPDDGVYILDVAEDWDLDRGNGTGRRSGPTRKIPALYSPAETDETDEETEDGPGMSTDSTESPEFYESDNHCHTLARYKPARRTLNRRPSLPSLLTSSIR